MRKRSLTRQVGVLFSEDAYDTLIRITDIQEIPVSKFIRQIVEEKIHEIDDEEENSNDASE